MVTKSRSQLMVERLRDLQASSPDIEASAVVSVDGLSIASALPQEVEEDRVSAMSAAMLSLGERIASELGRGSLQQVYIKGEKGYVILMSVGEEAVLTALAREQAKLGLIFFGHAACGRSSRQIDLNGRCLWIRSQKANITTPIKWRASASKHWRM